MKKQIISLFLSNGSYSSFIERILVLAKKKQSSYVCVANVHMTIEAHWDKRLAAMVNEADLVTPDGMPLVKAVHLLYKVKQERVAGMDILPDLIKETEKQDLSIFFYGGTQEMLDRTKEYVETNYPLLKNHQYFSPPFRPLTEEEEQEVVKRINNSGANLVFVALGCPKQEKWMASMKGKIHACMIGVGGALPVVIGMQRRAPMWMQKTSTEWLFRLILEPRRLFKRYFTTNSIFIVLFLKELLRIRLKKILSC